jgi:hypothetical protein
MSAVTASRRPGALWMRPARKAPGRGGTGTRPRQAHEPAGTAVDRLTRRAREVSERLDRMPLTVWGKPGVLAAAAGRDR